MKLKLTSGLGLAFLFLLFFSGCQEKKEDQAQLQEKEGNLAITPDEKQDLLNNEFSESKAEIIVLMGEIKQAVSTGNVDKLISFHAYGPKFTEFKNGEPRNSGEENEKFEREIFGNVTDVEKFEYNDLKIAVYGDVANVTFHSDFHLKFGADAAVVNDQNTLLLVNTENGWKIVHEHHSPLKKLKD